MLTAKCYRVAKNVVDGRFGPDAEAQQDMLVWLPLALLFSSL